MSLGIWVPSWTCLPSEPPLLPFSFLPHTLATTGLFLFSEHHWISVPPCLCLCCLSELSARWLLYHASVQIFSEGSFLHLPQNRVFLLLCSLRTLHMQCIIIAITYLFTYLSLLIDHIFLKGQGCLIHNTICCKTWSTDVNKCSLIEWTFSSKYFLVSPPLAPTEFQ